MSATYAAAATLPEALAALASGARPVAGGTDLVVGDRQGKAPLPDSLVAIHLRPHGLYLLNVYRLPHDHEAPETIGVPRLLFSLTFLAFGLYLLPGMFKSDAADSRRAPPAMRRAL